ncbi:transposase family protein [Pontibacter pudoricolor]
MSQERRKPDKSFKLMAVELSRSLSTNSWDNAVVESFFKNLKIRGQ